MDLAGYVALTRQSGLAKELQSVANNIANLSTTGYRREGVIFAEAVGRCRRGWQRRDDRCPRPLHRQAAGRARGDRRQARPRDRGRGLLHRDDAAGRAADPRRRLHPQRRGRRRQHGRPSAARRGRRRDHHSLRGEGVGVAADGTLSVDGAPAARIGLVDVADQTKLFREAGVLFRADAAPSRSRTAASSRASSSNRTSTRSPRWRGWSRSSAPTSTARS